MGKKKQNKKIDMQSITLFTILILFLGIGIFAVVQTFQGGEEKEVTPVEINYEGQPMIGDNDAPVKIIKFGDYKCPACKSFHDTVYPLLKKDYIDTGKVQFYFHNYQFLGQDSVTAGMIGEAIHNQDPDAYWKYYDLIYENQKDESTVWATPEFLLPLVKKNIPEVDIDQINNEVKEKKYEEKIKQDNQYAQQLMLNSVPSVFINGYAVDSPLDYREIKDLIEKELGEQ